MILYGASGHGKVIADILQECKHAPVEFWDDVPSADFNFKVSKTPADFSAVHDEVVVSIGINATRKRIVEKLDGNVRYGTAIHPKSVLSNTVTIAEGTVVMAGAVINIDTVVGRHCIINTNASVDHDCVIGDYVHISPNVALCGNVTIGEGTHMGAGSVAIPGIKIGKWASIGAGTVVIRDVPDYATVVGNPGKVIKTNA
jgi:sugar O-acyltransferase (sialic acid O-acetyltransferase NeuD family)